MPRTKSEHFETFGDGVLSICSADERVLTETKVNQIRFGNRTVGVHRFWQAKTAGNKVDRLVSIPLAVADFKQIDICDVVIIDTEKNRNSKNQYQITQMQPKYDAVPPVLYLSLEKVLHPFKDERNE